MLYDKLLLMTEHIDSVGQEAPNEGSMFYFLKRELPATRLFEFRDQHTIIDSMEKYGIEFNTSEPLQGLPFEVVTIEDGSQSTTVRRAREENTYCCCTIFPMRRGPQWDNACIVKMNEDSQARPIIAHAVMFTRLCLTENTVEILASVGIDEQKQHKGKPLYFQLEEKYDQTILDIISKMQHHCLRLTFGALRLCMLPKLWVVEKKPAKVRKHNAKRAARSHHRPRYTLMTISQIAKVIKNKKLQDEAKKGTRSSHFRRGHMRTFHSERFKFMQGKSIYIEPQWIGPKEGTNGKYKYRVLTDK